MIDRNAGFPRWLGLALLSAALFGAATPACKALLSTTDPFQLAGLLYLGAALASAPSAFGRSSRGLPSGFSSRSRRYLLGAVLCGGVAGPVLLLFGLRLASATSVSMWLNLELVATAVLGRLFFRDHLGGLGSAGVAGVVLAGGLLSAGEGAAGIRAGLLVAAACLCWGLDNHFTALIDGITPAQSTFWKGCIAGVMNLAIGLVSGPGAASPLAILLALCVGVLAYGVSIMLYIMAAQGMGATRAQTVFASAPFFGVALSSVFLDERFSTIQGGACILLIASVIVLLLDRHHHVHEHDAATHQHEHRHDDGHHDHAHPGLVASHRHSHWHEHPPLTHAHPHWPDLHHRHEHR